ncbi:MAG: TGS domain-containing protein, partial [Steroidobacteraceae bacterium]
TREMQQQAERGVAAHWRYKEGGRGAQDYEGKIEAVRELLERSGSAPDADDALARASAGLFSDRIYALTPTGEVVDLPNGATPLDFAFHVHSDLGQRCRGAKINGRIVPLDTRVANGDVVDVITARNATPSRDWLAADSKYLASPRSRSKLRAYFRKIDEATTPATPVSLEEPAPPVELPIRTPRKRAPTGKNRSPVDIEGVGDLPVILAQCCAPVRPQPIVGYLTLARGVTIHRVDCTSFARMLGEQPERRLNVEWASGNVGSLPITVALSAYDRRGLLRDITDLIAEEHLSIEGVSSNTDPDDRIASIEVRLTVPDMGGLTRLLQRLRQIPNVFEVRRAG